MARKPPPKPIHGRVAAITGGARGIGRTTAAALVARGARVALGDIDRELVERTAGELGGETIGVELDVTSRDSFEEFYRRATEELGPVDVLINNAGIMPLGMLVEESDDIAERMVDINLHGVILGSKIAMREMAPRGSGHIVNIASQAGLAGIPGGATYCATKHGVVGLTSAMELELEGTGVEVSCVMPAVVNTELGQGTGKTRGVQPIEPEDVANEIVAALERPRVPVFVPRSNATIFKILQILPRGAARRFGKLLGGDRVLIDADPAARAAYDARIRGESTQTSREREPA